MTEAIITELGRAGDGVVRRDGSPPLHVRGALPDERVKLGSTTKTRGVLRAAMLELLTSSDARVKPACTVVDRCGGCPLAHASRSLQAQAKRAWLESALASAGLDASAVTVDHTSPEPSHGYRVRTRLAWARGKGASHAVVGYREGDGREVVAPDRCEVLVPRLEAARAEITASLADVLEGSGEIRLGLSATDEGPRVVAAFLSEQPQASAFFTRVGSLVADGTILGARVQVGGANVPTHFGDALERSHDLEGRTLSASIGGFRQAHLAATETLSGRVLAWGQPAGLDVIELHAGHGHFTLSLAAVARSLAAIELDAEAAGALRDNLRAHGLSAEVRTEDAATALDRVIKDVRSRRRAAPELVVLDPPRTGARDEITRLEALAPPRVVYVSCDLTTFARDAARLTRTVPLRRVALVDLFPDTLHTELVALFER